MKARIQQEPRCALVWGVAAGSTAQAAVEHAARLCRVRVRTVSAADLETPVGALCAGRRGSAAAPAPEELSRPALIVSGLRHDDGTLGRFVDEVRRGGADIPLRAMVTPTSRDWTLAALLAELNREHEAVSHPTPAQP